ncbi:MAG: HyaD/HybD family hydrogenase maturation endopeptidase [bacterium]|nr:HyaD/HybD family hydrogenase maturation endopeptidase [bacterium]
MKNVKDSRGRQDLPSPSLSKKIVIVGIGNILLTDEGIGVHVISELKKEEIPSYIEIIDAGTATIDLIDSICDVDKLILIDAVKGGGKAGSIYKFDPSDIEFEKEVVSSLHQVGLIEVLNIAQKLGRRPKDVVVIGVEPKEIRWGLELSKEIKEKIPEIIKLVLKEVNINA